MYQISCDGYILYDVRDDSLIVSSPKCKLEVNTVGEASFSIYSNHPYYGHLQKLRSVFEIKQNNDVIFRGRMTDDSKDFNKVKVVDLEGAMAYFNDSVIRPFNFPEDFLDDEHYNASINKVEFFLKWLIDTHNAQVQDFQKFKLGNVTVSDVNNYITRSNESYANTWETLKTKLFESALGGYLCIRYEADGNYIDYLSDFELTNTQRVRFGENLLNLVNESNAGETYSAVLPLGGEIKETNEEGNETSRTITLETLPDGEITEDIVKSGEVIYSKSAVERYGFILAPTEQTKWNDVIEVENLKTKAIEYLTGTAMMLKDTININAIDLNCTNEEIASFKIYRYVEVESAPHELEDRYKLTKLEIDISNPQNTQIQLGNTKNSLVDSNYNKYLSTQQKIENTKNELKEYVSNKVDEVSGIGELDDLRQTMIEQTTTLTNTCEEIIFSALQSYVEKGIGVSTQSVKRYYLASSSDNGISIDNEGWSESIPTLTEANNYLWTYEEISYSDITSKITEPYILANYNGLEITSIIDYFAINSNEENPVNLLEDGTECELDWLTEVPSMTSNNMYLWNYNVITYSDETTVGSDKKLIADYKYSYYEFMEVVSSQLKLLTDELSVKFKETTQYIEDVNGDLQEKYNTIEQYFTFDINGLTIGQSDSPCKVIIDEDSIELLLNDNPLLWMDVVTGETHTKKLTVTQEMNLFGYKISEDDSGNVNLEYIG